MNNSENKKKNPGEPEDIQAYRRLVADLEIRAELLNRDLVRVNFELNQTKNRLESVLFAMEDGVIATDPQGRVVVINRVAQIIIFGLGSENPIGRPLDEVFSDPRLSEKLEEIESTGRPASLDMELSIPELRIYLVGLTPIRGLDGNFTGVVVSFRDITTLRELERMKGAFLNTVSHELRTPMTSIRAFSELMSKKEPKVEKVKEWSGIIYQEAERLGRLIDDLLDVSRLEAGKKLSIIMADFKLPELVEHTVALFSSQRSSHPIEIDLDKSLSNMVGDVDRLHQVMANLISNAIKYTPQGGVITVRAQIASEDKVRVEIEDQGMGLSDKDKVYVFEKFYRVESKTGVEIGGTGLGLSICKYIIQAHGGEIGVSSELEKGSIFWFEVPRVSVVQETDL